MATSVPTAVTNKGSTKGESSFVGASLMAPTSWVIQNVGSLSGTASRLHAQRMAHTTDTVSCGPSFVPSGTLKIETRNESCVESLGCPNYIELRERVNNLLKGKVTCFSSTLVKQ